MKKSSSSNRFVFLRNASLFFLLILFISNCKEKEEGCLDIEAVNFAFSADKPCPDDCCEYPKLTFEISFRWDSQSLVYGKKYNLTFDTVIKVTKTKFYISDISLTNGAESFKIRDRIELDVNGSSSNPTTFVDDFTLASRDFTSFSYTIGEIRGSGSFDTLRFSIGLDNVANKINPNSAPDGHPLSIQADSMWSVENAYVFNKLFVTTETIPMVKRLVFEVTGEANRVDIVLPFKVDLAIGTNLTVPIKVDYFKWFEGINFVGDSTEVVDDIVRNTPNAFSINQ
jgi:hypothetical protein